MKVYIAGKITGESRASVAEKFASAKNKALERYAELCEFSALENREDEL